MNEDDQIHQILEYGTKKVTWNKVPVQVAVDNHRRRRTFDMLAARGGISILTLLTASRIESEILSHET